MSATVETLEDDKVKLTVDVDDAELDAAIDEAFKRIAKEVRIPGFRPGKAPRKVIESHIGPQAARGDALQQAIPAAYSAALRDHQIDAIDQPEIDITAGETEGTVTFDAVVPVRPTIVVNGHGGITIEVPDIEVTDEDIDEQIDNLRKSFAAYETVERPAEDGDKAVIDISATQNGEPVEAVSAEDYAFEIGLGSVVPEIDENLRGAEAGAELTFTADHPIEGEDELEFTLKVHEVTEPALPDVTDEWVQEASEFETVEDLRADVTERVTTEKLHAAETVYNNELSRQLSELCEDDPPEALVSAEMQHQIQDMAMRLQGQGLTLEQYLQFSGQDPESFTEQTRESAEVAARIDLVLRAVSAQEDLAATEDDLTEEFEKAAEQLGVSVDEVRDRFDQSGQVLDVTADLSKRKAYEWVADRATITTESGATIEASDLEHSHDDGAHDHGAHNDGDHNDTDDEGHDHEDGADESGDAASSGGTSEEE